jgi:hypothetical protein
MSDVVERLRAEIANGKDFHVLMIETAREIRGLTEEIERLRLTSEEREAIADAIQAGEFDANLFDCQWAQKHAATLRGLLERTR